LKLRAFGLLSLLAIAGCHKANPADNSRVPEPNLSTVNPVYNHRFDGGETDPYFKPGDNGGGEGAGEKPAKE
jgi:hypothetical protein